MQITPIVPYTVNSTAHSATRCLSLSQPHNHQYAIYGGCKKYMLNRFLTAVDIQQVLNRNHERNRGVTLVEKTTEFFEDT